MPHFEATSPDGHVYAVTAPGGSAQANVLGYVQAHHEPQFSKPAPLRAAFSRQPGEFAEVGLSIATNELRP